MVFVLWLYVKYRYALLASSFTVGVAETPFMRTVQLSSAVRRFFGIVTLQKPVVLSAPSTITCIMLLSWLKLKSVTVELLIKSTLKAVPSHVPASKDVNGAIRG